ncbi:hypothetical protein [Flavobacterium sp. N1994]|uniref:hypothetical protein n=1 Tax=Flavobacterium sp. N1994 TaxID=2986827 RepID=UPI0022212B71|nr:hypothetical protein [Flavobacterium sp. N1994]
MKQQVTIDPSIAAVVNIASVGKKEIVPIYFTAPENWSGDYTFKLWNSDVKNTEILVTGTPIGIATNVMTLTIDPTAQAIPKGLYYYEIMHTQTSRVLFKGTLNIVE